MSGELDRREIQRAELTEHDIWYGDVAAVWRSPRFVGRPVFYPVYRWADLYSHSPLPLLLAKGTLRLDGRVVRAASRPDFLYYSGRETIDRDIVRIGGPLRSERTLTHPDALAATLAKAMADDIADVEAALPDHAHVVLCGGKDSENITLLPWRRPIVVASAPPNYELNREFLRRNDLPHEIVCLRDDEPGLSGEEILANSCRMSLEHLRWIPHLKCLVRERAGRVVVWSGAAADLFLTPSWRHVVPAHSVLARRGSGLLRSGLRRVGFGLADGLLQRLFHGVLWSRVAMWQGATLSLMRQVLGVRVLSAYHGPRASEVVHQIDLGRAVREDVRPRIGARLRGRPPWYPASNPGPPLSSFRRGWAHPERFAEELRARGVRLQD